MSSYNRCLLLRVLVIALTILLSGCTGIPQYTLPRPLADSNQQERFSSPTPADSASPEMIIRSFFKATAFPQENYAAARQYLTSDASQQWSKVGGVSVIDQTVDIFPGIRDDNTQKVSVRATSLGSLDETGHFQLSGGQINIEMTMKEVLPGKWRIDQIPVQFGVLIDRSEFALTYHAYNLYYITHDLRSVIPDPRWLFCGNQTVASCIIQALVRGPSSALNGVVEDEFSNGNRLRSENVQVDITQGVKINLTEFSHVDSYSAHLIAAQIIWTLLDAGIAGPYYINAANVPLISGLNRGMTKQDVSTFDPMRFSNRSYGMHALFQGSLWRVNGDKLSRVSWVYAPVYFDSVALSKKSSKVAAVSGTASGNAVLWVGDYRGSLSILPQLGSAHTISHPCWDRSEMHIWVIVDGHKIVRVNLSNAADSALSERITDVKIVDFSTKDDEISTFQVSPDGTRAAFIYGGSPYVGSILDDHNSISLVHVEPLEYEQNRQTTALSWMTDDSLLLGSSNAGAPVERVWLNGLQRSNFPRTNLTAPILGVFYEHGFVYVLDSRSVWWFSSVRGVGYWQEVTQFLPQEQAGITVIPVFRE